MGKQTTANMDYREEERLTCVLVLDYFNSFTNELASYTGLPICLWPVDGKPLLDYTIHTLLRSGIQEIILIATTQAYEIRSYMMNSQWIRNDPKSIRFISCSKARSLGDCLKDLEQENIISNDFLLLYGNGILLTNEKLNRLFEIHKENISKDKNCIMTLVHRQLDAEHLEHPSNTDDQHSCLIRDANTHRVYDYSKEDLDVYEIPLELLEKPNVNIEVLYCPLDCHLAMCSTRVLHLFKDNFDCSTIPEFVKGVLRDEVLANDTIYSFIYQSGYFLSVHNLQLYMKGTLDVLRRWTYPIVPDILASMNKSSSSVATTPSTPQANLIDSNLLFQNISYPIVYDKHNIYKQGDIQLDRLSDIQQDVFIGHRTQISSGVTLRATLIGQNCVIGKNTRIENSIIWNNVKIGENCVIRNSIICDNVILRNQVEIGKECVLCKGVVIDNNVRLTDGLTIIASTLTNPMMDDVEIDEELQLTPDNFRRSNSKQRRSSTRLSEKSFSDRSISSTHEETMTINKDLVGPEGIGKELVYRSAHDDQGKDGEPTDDDDDDDDDDQKNQANAFDAWGRRILRSTDQANVADNEDDGVFLSGPKRFSAVSSGTKNASREQKVSIDEEEDDDDSGEESDESGEGETSGEEDEDEDQGEVQGRNQERRSATHEFELETLETLKRAYKKNVQLGNITAELQMLKPTFAVSSSGFDRAITRAVFLLPFEVQKIDEKNYFSVLKLTLDATTQAILKNYLKNNDEEAQMTLMNGLHDVCLERVNIIGRRIVQILHYLYENDVIGEEWVLKWYDSQGINGRTVKPEQRIYYDKLQEFVQWLREAESEDDDDEDDD